MVYLICFTIFAIANIPWIMLSPKQRLIGERIKDIMIDKGYPIPEIPFLKGRGTRSDHYYYKAFLKHGLGDTYPDLIKEYEHREKIIYRSAWGGFILVLLSVYIYGFF